MVKTKKHPTISDTEWNELLRDLLPDVSYSKDRWY